MASCKHSLFWNLYCKHQLLAQFFDPWHNCNCTSRPDDNVYIVCMLVKKLVWMNILVYCPASPGYRVTVYTSISVKEIDRFIVSLASTSFIPLFQRSPLEGLASETEVRDYGAATQHVTSFLLPAGANTNDWAWASKVAWSSRTHSAKRASAVFCTVNKVLIISLALL